MKGPEALGPTKPPPNVWGRGAWAPPAPPNFRGRGAKAPPAPPRSAPMFKCKTNKRVRKYN